MTINPDIVRLIRADLTSAPRGARSAVINRWSRQLNIARQTVYRAVNKAAPAQPDRKPRADKGQCKIDGIDAAAMVVAMVKKTPPKHKGEIALDDALKIAIDNGLVPEEMAGCADSIGRVIRERGASQRSRRVCRYQAERPNQLHHVDASTSDVFYVHDVVASGDVILRMHKGHPTYKNKPVPVRLRPWIYGLTDDYSGVHVCRYVPALGETAVDNLDFLGWAWAKTEGKELFGIPERVKGDLGPMMRGPEAADFFARLGISKDASVPGEKDAHGKIERPWRTLWQRFERAFFVEPDSFEISLSDLNLRLVNYSTAYNRKPHRWERRVTRIDAWKRINAHGGAIALSPGAIATVARRYERTVGRDGVLWLDGAAYEVPDIHDRKVWVWVGALDGRIVVEDIQTRERREVTPFRPNPLDTFRAPKDTENDKAHKAAVVLRAEGGLRNTLHVEAPAAAAGNVVGLPVRVREILTPASPMETAGLAYPSLAAAVAAFSGLTGIFPAEGSPERKELEFMILDSGLSREFVADLAAEVAGQPAMKGAI